MGMHTGEGLRPAKGNLGRQCRQVCDVRVAWEAAASQALSCRAREQSLCSTASRCNHSQPPHLLRRKTARAFNISPNALLSPEDWRTNQRTVLSGAATKKSATQRGREVDRAADPVWTTHITLERGMPVKKRN